MHEKNSSHLLLDESLLKGDFIFGDVTVARGDCPQDDAEQDRETGRAMTRSRRQTKEGRHRGKSHSILMPRVSFSSW